MPLTGSKTIKIFNQAPGLLDQRLQRNQVTCAQDAVDATMVDGERAIHHHRRYALITSNDRSTSRAPTARLQLCGGLTIAEIECTRYIPGLDSVFARVVDLMLLAQPPTQPTHVQIGKQRRNRSALWDPASAVLVRRCSLLPAFAVLFFHRRIEPHLDQTQQVLVRDPACHRLHQFSLRN